MAKTTLPMVRREGRIVTVIYGGKQDRHLCCSEESAVEVYNNLQAAMAEGLRQAHAKKGRE